MEEKVLTLFNLLTKAQQAYIILKLVELCELAPLIEKKQADRHHH